MRRRSTLAWGLTAILAGTLVGRPSCGGWLQGDDADQESAAADPAPAPLPAIDWPLLSAPTGGALDRMPLRGVVSVHLEGERMKSESATGYQEAYGAIRELGSKLRGQRTTGGSGSNYWHVEFDSDEMTLHGVYGDQTNPRLENPRLKVRLAEHTSPQRYVLLDASDSEQLLRVTLLDGAVLPICCIGSNPPTGGCGCSAFAEARSPCTGHRHAAAFFQSCPTEVVHEIAAAMAYLQIGDLVNLYGPEAQALVAALLVPTDTAAEEAFEEAIAELDSPKFETREAAMKNLIANAAPWRHLMLAAIGDEGRSAEARNRLRTLLIDCSSDSEKDLVVQLVDGQLLGDRAYLAAVLEAAGDPALQEALSRRLQQLAAQPQPATAAAETSVASAATTAAPLTGDQIWSAEGGLRAGREVLADWVPIRLRADHWVLDSGAWLELYGGQDPQGLRQSLEAELLRRKLPRRWLSNETTNPQIRLDFPQLMFDRLEEVYLDLLPPEAREQRRAYSGQSRYMRFSRFEVSGVSAAVCAGRPWINPGGRPACRPPNPSRPRPGSSSTWRKPRRLSGGSS